MLHPPSVYDFRERLIVGGPIADLVPSSSIFEMYPIGFSFLGEYLERHGIEVRVANLAARMLEQPRFDVEKFIKKLTPRAFGISLHWLPHCQGAVEIARICKRLHPEIPVVMGGYSASIFHQELLEYPEVDYVVRGDSAEEPLLQLMKALQEGDDVADIPNISYRDGASGKIIENDLGYVPADLDHIQDNYIYMAKSAIRYRDLRGIRAFKNWWSYPMTAVLTCKGCLNDCTFCGGSAWSMWRCFRRNDLALRSPEMVARDVEQIASITGAPIFVIGDILQPGREYAWEVIEHLGRIAPANHLVFELFQPAPRDFFERLGTALPNFDLEISPDSHDVIIRRATGKHYSNEQLEANLTWALENGCSRFDVFFMIGLEGQTPGSVMDSVDYCAYLLDRHGVRVNPLMGPLAPFLDPGSLNQAHPEKHGYNLLLHSLEDHRRALLEPHWRDVLGYETRWMTRQEIVDTTYSALLELNRIKAAHGQVTADHAAAVETFLESNVELLERLDRAAAIEESEAREAELASLKPEADTLRLQSDLVKKELEWPVEGKRFHYANIARLAFKKETVKHERRKRPKRTKKLVHKLPGFKKADDPAERAAQKKRRRVLGLSIASLAALVSILLLVDFVYSRVASSETFNKPPYAIYIAPDAAGEMKPVIESYVNKYGKGKLEIALEESTPDVVIDKIPRSGYAGARIDGIPSFELTAGDLKKTLRPAHRYWFCYKQNGLLLKSKNRRVAALEDYLEKYWDSLPAINFNAVGDIIPARHVAEIMAKRGVDWPFERIAPVVRGADVVLGDLECALTDRVTPSYEGMYFSASPKAIEGIKTLGINVLTLANNHITNYDRSGLMDTINLLRSNNIKYTGGGENYIEAHRPAIVEAGGVKFAFLDYNSVEESIQATATKPGVAWVSIPPENPQEAKVVEDDIKRAKEQADFVVVSIHWGNEYDYRPNSSTIAMARKACDAGADMVIGQHPHTIQSMESYNGKLIAYCLGNFIFDQRFSEQVRDGVVLKCSFKKNVPVSAKLVPYRISDTCQTVPFKGDGGQYILDRLFEISGWKKQGK